MAQQEEVLSKKVKGELWGRSTARAAPRPWPCPPAPHSVARGARAGSQQGAVPGCLELRAQRCPPCRDAATEHARACAQGPGPPARVLAGSVPGPGAEPPPPLTRGGQAR